MTYRGRTTFRATKASVAVTVALALIVGIIAAVSWRSGEATWVTAIISVVFLSLLVGLVEASTSFVKLSDSEFRMRKNFRTIAIPRDDIDAVSVAKGCPISLKLRNGRHVELPDLGYQGLDNSLRA